MHNTQIFDLIDRIGQLLRQQQRELGSQLGLQPIHLQVMHYLSQCNRYSDTPLAVTKYFGTTKGTISQTILVLTKKGLVKKTVDSDDRRIVHLGLTAKASKMLNVMHESIDLRQLLNSVGLENIDITEQALKKILINLQKANDHYSFGECFTCRHFQKEASNNYRCGLTQEPLKEPVIIKICVEHEIT